MPLGPVTGDNIAQLIREGYPRNQAIAIALSHEKGLNMARNGNPEKGPAGSQIATQSEMGDFIEELDRITLYATQLGKTRKGVKGWETEVFQAVNPPRWTGSPFFRSSDAQRIYDMGYRKIIVMGGGGDAFDVDLVMQ